MVPEQHAKRLLRSLGCACILLLGSSALAQNWMNTFLRPSVLQIREAAGKGDSVAQQKLGSAYNYTAIDRPH